ncbi:leucine-rich repeat flightless-interacting protein 2 isoform X17 [Kryptolebias marmoratus]|uniref:leucine-rich repeat flightless-interacting protein 2 isoform X17 n=1 Tax=Kryptolebias marmoratus TaxID=37003 RepID=UPI0018ACDF75|nr:leucine-rich repeat flightless-interacting protein 2 isoform X17 [Kryptolebias marmoratus]
MGTQGTGRRRSTKKERATAEEDALNLIAREAEARLAVKRAARAEAREIRLKELERQQKEIFQVQKKYYGLNTKLDERADGRWGDIEQWMEDSEKYSRSSGIPPQSDDDERMSVGSRGSVRSDLDSVGAYGGGGSSSLKKSKKKKKHKHRERDKNGFDDDYSVLSSRSSRLSDESRMSRSSRADLQPASYSSSDLFSLNDSSSCRNQSSAFNGYQSSVYEDSLCSGPRRVPGSGAHPLELGAYRGSRASSRTSSARTSPVENCGSVASFLRGSAGTRDLDRVSVPDFSDVEDKDYPEKGSRAASALTATTLTSLGGTSSRRGSGDTSLTVHAEIKEIHDLKDQIQDVESKFTQNLKEAKDALAEAEEKYRKAMVSNAQLDNEKNNLMYQVDTLKDSLMELEELLSESRREHEEKLKEFEREKHAHAVLQFQFAETKETLKQSEELLNKHGIVLGPDLSVNGEVDEPASRPAPDPSPAEGNSMLEIRLRKLVDEREKMIEQVKKLKAQLEQKAQKNGSDSSSSPEAEILENGNDPNIMDLQRDSSRQINDLKFKLVKAEQEATALEQNVTRLEGQVTRYKSAAENAEKVEDELKAEKRKLQRELRSALDKVEELESNNSHLCKRLEKMKSSRGMAQTP